MPDRPLIRLTVAHAYHQPAEPPVQVLAAGGTVVRRLGTQFAVILPDRQDVPERVSLALLWQDLDFGFITEGYDWSAVPVLEAPPGRDQLTFGEAPVLRHEPRGPGDRRILQLEIGIGPDQPRDIRLDFEAVAAYWVYHLTGRGLRDDFRIVDAGETVRFDDLGPETLPNGAPARALRSTAPLPLRARPSQRFTLQYEGQFGPVVLVPTLPAAGVRLRPLADDQTTGAQQADIYVTLS